MDEAIAESFHSSLKEFQADGGHTEGVVNWIDDAREAQIVCGFHSPASALS